MDQHINVTFRMNGASHDLRIPTRMEVRRLIRELDQIFGSAMEPRSKYQLRVVNKGILLDEGKNSVPLDAFHQYDLQPSIAYKVYDDYSILAMVKQNMGISMMYGLVVRDFENNVVIKPIQENVERTIALACLKKEYLSKASKQLYEYIQKNVTKILEDGLLKHEK